MIGALLASAALGLAPLPPDPAAALQRGGSARDLDDLPPSHPARCPYTGGDPALLAKLGVVALGGGFDFANSNTASIDERFPTARILWAETEHFEIGLALPPYKIKGKERDKLQPELAELSEILPEVSERARSLDPWLRLYLTCIRLEKLWDRFLEVVRVEESAFPDGESTWILGTPYMGEGPYAGMKGKYEVLVLPTESHHTEFLREEFGLSIRTTQRWHVIERGTLIVVAHLQQEGLRIDEALHAHLWFNVGQNLLDGFQHYAYDLPVWLREGFAHAMEREVSEAFNSFDGSEGSTPAKSRKEDWAEEVEELVSADEAPRISQLLSRRNYGELSTEDHFVSWSMTRFLLDEHGEGYACLLDALSGMKNEQGYTDGSGLEDKHRDAFRDCLGLSYLEFDRAWRNWVLGTQPEPEPRD